MLKILVDGKESRLYTDSGTQFVSLDDHTIEVIWEFTDPELSAMEDIKDKHPCIYHRFSQEGVIVEGGDDDTFYAISHGLWDQFAEDGGMI